MVIESFFHSTKLYRENGNFEMFEQNVEMPAIKAQINCCGGIRANFGLDRAITHPIAPLISDNSILHIRFHTVG
ncbi:hypothetical protein Nepgr_012368 [Nepenthes gracilis]|uniref:Uncharacterized protein n=1 Tax=Nepenthes gracilis TaxID=150966 RepID=A0AAD3XMR2_NEPGR|nr:hypothetical protein Nepgr_012368 [Nepenthes gracilis]